MSTELSEVEKSVAEFDRVGAGLAMLKEQYGGIVYDVTTTDGMKEAKAARSAIREPRYEIERIRKAAKAPILALGKKLDSEAARITAELEKLEQPINDSIKDEELRKERERQEKIEAEQKRVETIQGRIAYIRSPVEFGTRYNTPSSDIAVYIKDAEAHVIDDWFQEFRQQADEAKTFTLVKLREAHAAAVAREEEQRKAAEAQAELANLRTEQVAREAKERAEREERERQEREKREAEERAAREKLAAEQTEVARKQKIEADRIATENKRLADERAAFEAQQAEARRAEEAERRKQAEAAEAERKRKEEAEKLARKSKYPGKALIVDTLAKHFGVTDAVVRSWLIELRKAA